MRPVVFAAVWVAAAAVLVGGAIDHEYAQTARAQADPPVRLQPPARYYQGLTAREWADRAVRNRRTINRLRHDAGRPLMPARWRAIGWCESGLDWDYNGPSGFDGALQFHPGTWSEYRLPGYPAFAYQASPFQQLVVAERVLAASGWGAWPACSQKVGLR